MSEHAAKNVAATLEQSKIALEFLKRFYPEGPWTLTAISLTKQNLPTQTFGPKSEDECLLFIDKWNGLYNLYFGVNPVREKIYKKASLTDIDSMAWLHVDIDPRRGKDLDAERQRIEKILTVSLPAGISKPTCVNFSGGGFQAFWRLSEPVPLAGNDPEELKKYNMRLEEVFGADSCHDLCRIMRLPGTWNLPDKGKAKKGRTATIASNVDFNDMIHDLDTFQKVQSQHVTGNQPSTIRVARVEPVIIPDVSHLKDHLDPSRLVGVAQSTIDNLGAMIVQGTYADPDKLEADKAAGKDVSRSKFVFTVACCLWRWGMPSEKIVGILLNSDFQISESVLEQKESLGYAWKQVDSAATEVAAEASPGGVDLLELNADHMFVSSINRIVCERYDELKERIVLDFLTVEAFKNTYNNRQVEVMSNGKPGLRPLGDFWLKNSQRRTYRNLAFAPGHGNLEKSYNLWRGFSVEPVEGDCSLFISHLREVVCNGVDSHFLYLVNWIARMIQTPETQSEVAVLLVGGPGTGKSLVGEVIGSLLGPHYQSLASPERITGKFNAHLRDCLFLLADEAFVASKGGDDAKIKDLITNRTHTIEGKGMEVQTFGNYIHLMMATNNELAVPVQSGERRYLVLKMSKEKQQNFSYFSAMMRQLDNGGREALLHLLLDIDLVNFNVRDVPHTEAFRDMQSETMVKGNSVDAFWYDLLSKKENLPGIGRWKERVEAGELFDNYIVWCDAQKVSGRKIAPQFGKILKQLHPSLRRKDVLTNGKTQRFYLFDTVEKAREDFELAMGKTNWDDSEEVVEGEPDEEESPF